MTSMVLASAYLGGAYFFLRVVVPAAGTRSSTGFLAVTVFASLLGVATVLHWDTFIHDRLAFWLWAGLYFTAPFLVIGAWLVNRRYAAPVAADDLLLRPVERGVIAAVGLGRSRAGVVMFVTPGIDDRPVAVAADAADLPGRRGGVLPGWRGAGVWFDPRWTPCG